MAKNCYRFDNENDEHLYDVYIEERIENRKSDMKNEDYHNMVAVDEYYVDLDRREFNEWCHTIDTISEMLSGTACPNCKAKELSPTSLSECRCDNCNKRFNINNV